MVEIRGTYFFLNLDPAYERKYTVFFFLSLAYFT
jgi:hypothetical protein